jgi:segregation and condensation protein A
MATPAAPELAAPVPDAPAEDHGPALASDSDAAPDEIESVAAMIAEEPAKAEIPQESESTKEPVVATPSQSVEVAAPVDTPSIEKASESIAIAAEAESEEAIAPEPEAAQEKELAAEEMETSSKGSEAAQIAEASPEEAVAPEVEPAQEETTQQTAPSHEPESAQAAEAAPKEEVAEIIDIASEAAPQETTDPEPAEDPATEIRSSATEPVPAAEPIAAPAPPASPQEIAPTLPFAEKPAGRTTAEKVAAALKAREARGEEADQSPFSVIVNQVYDGPLDLLLDLIRKQDIDIYDIPIAKITAQFLAYVDRLRASDMDVAGDFIYTAALLIHIKSKMLLPRAPAGPDDAADDPRRELVERLLEHERFKNAAQMLREKQMLEAATWTNPGMREFQEDAAAEPEIAADTTDLVRVFNDILERARNRPIINVEEDSVTVGQMIQFLARRLTMEDRPVALRRMLSHTKSERALIAMFLALLELVRLQAILLRQDRQFSEIFIKKNTGFDALMNQGLAEARDDWR